MSASSQTGSEQKFAPCHTNCATGDISISARDDAIMVAQKLNRLKDHLTLSEMELIIENCKKSCENRAVNSTLLKQEDYRRYKTTHTSESSDGLESDDSDDDIFSDIPDNISSVMNSPTSNAILNGLQNLDLASDILKLDLNIIKQQSHDPDRNQNDDIDLSSFRGNNESPINFAYFPMRTPSPKSVTRRLSF